MPSWQQRMWGSPQLAPHRENCADTVFLGSLSECVAYPGGMTNNDPKPDRAQPGDLDGLSDIPTYHTDDAAPADRSGTSTSGRVRSVYERAGRTAPQSIKPPADAEPTTAFERPQATEEFQASSSSNLYKVNEPEHTTALPREEVVAPVAIASEPEFVATDEPVAPASVADARRGTIDFGIAIIRVVAGALLIFNALRTFFELGGAPGLTGLKEQYANYAFPDLLSIAIPTMELASGVFLLLGLLTPVAAALATVVTAFNALHAIAQADSFSFGNPGDSVLLAGLLCALALGLQFTGPGRISLDAARSWARRPLASSWILAIVGIAGAVALWWFGAAVNPF